MVSKRHDWSGGDLRFKADISAKAACGFSRVMQPAAIIYIMPSAYIYLTYVISMGYIVNDRRYNLNERAARFIDVV